MKHQITATGVTHGCPKRPPVTVSFLAWSNRHWRGVTKGLFCSSDATVDTVLIFSCDQIVMRFSSDGFDFCSNCSPCQRVAGIAKFLSLSVSFVSDTNSTSYFCRPARPTLKASPSVSRTGCRAACPTSIVIAFMRPTKIGRSVVVKLPYWGTSPYVSSSSKEWTTFLRIT